jgi:polygalacturonase/lysophospholipase L1-like esterase
MSRPPEFPAPVAGCLDVRAFGARGDGRTLDTEAINRAIIAAHAAGGGIVHFPAGNYLSVSIRLLSHVTLSLGPGTIIEAAAHTQHPYDEPEPGNELEEKYSSFGHSHWRNSLIWGIGLENIGVVGPGRLYGRGLVRDRQVPTGAGNKAIALKLCRNVVLRDFSILRGGHFAILLSGTDNVAIDRVTIDTQRDGLDVDSCRHVQIAGCRINSPFDDGICLKSSFALGFPRATENVAITNCSVSGYDVGSLLDGTCRRDTDFTRALPPGAMGESQDVPQASSLLHRGGPTGRIKFGTESNGGFRNIAIANCVFDYCRGLALEAVDGGVLEDIAITNLVMRDIQNCPIFIRLGNRGRAPGAVPVSVVRRILISQVVASNVDPRFGCILAGLPGHCIEEITLRDIRIVYRGGGTREDAARQPEEHEKSYPEPYIFGPMPAYGFFIRHVRGIRLHSVVLAIATDDQRPALVLDDVTDITLDQVKVQTVPGVTPLVTRNVAGLAVVGSPSLGALAHNLRRRVFVLGDSISMQYGPALERLLAPHFEYDRKRDDGAGTSANLDDPNGANGGDSRMVLAYLRSRRSHQPISADILLLNCGLHDIRTDPVTQAKRTPIDEYRANLQAILTEAAAMGLRVVWVRTTPVIDRLHNSRCEKFHRFAADVDAYNQAADEIMRAAGVPILDLHAFTLPLLPGALIDHAHFDEVTREKQAVFLAAGLRSLAESGALPATGSA